MCKAQASIFLLFLVIFCFSVQGVSLDANVSNVPFDFASGQENTFYFTISLFAGGDYFENGDLVDVRFWVCSNEFCEEAHKEVFVFSAPKVVTGSFSHYVPSIANDSIVESVQVVFFAKRAEEVSFEVRKIFSFSGAFATENPIYFPLPVSFPEADFSFYFLLAGVGLIFLSIVLIKFRHWAALFPLIAGIVLITLNIFA